MFCVSPSRCSLCKLALFVEVTKQARSSAPPRPCSSRSARPVVTAVTTPPGQTDGRSPVALRHARTKICIPYLVLFAIVQ